MSKKNRKARAVASNGSTTPAIAQVSEALPVSHGLRLSSSVGTGYVMDENGLLKQGVAVDAALARQMYKPAKTLGASDDIQAACDHALEENGVYSLLAHTLNMGSMPMTQFMGYGALQNIAQNGLIRACIETVADDMTRNWIELKREGEVAAKEKTTGDIFMESLGLAPREDGESEDKADDTLIADLNAAMEKYNLQKVFHEAATLVGYEGGAMVFIDTGAQGDELKLPLNMTEYSQELRGHHLRFVCIDPVNVFPGLYNSTSPLREDYFKPVSWWVLGQEVHASRLLRLTANECPVLLKPAYNFFGIPQAQILWDYVLHFQECRVASQRLLSKFSLTVFKTEMSDVLTQAAGTENIDRRINYLVQNRSNDGVLVMDKNSEDVVKLETPISGVTDIVRQSLEILAALNRTPAVKLLGISPSGFNATGESDIRNYYDHIKSQQEKVLRDALTTCLKVIQIHDKGEIDKTVTFDFAALGEADNAAIAATQKTKTDTMVALLQNNVISPEEARRALADDPDSGFNNIDVDELPEPQGGEMDGMGGMPDMGGEEPAQDAEPENWASTKSGAHFPVEEGESRKDACSKFLEKKEQEHAEEKQGKNKNLTAEEMAALAGPEITGVKGQDAIAEIVRRGEGHVKAAFHRNDIGDIDLIWGDGERGLKHIMDRREAQKIDVEKFISNLSDVIEKGEIERLPDGRLRKNGEGRYEIKYEGKMAVVEPEFSNGKWQLLLTAFVLDKKLKKELRNSWKEKHAQSN